MATIPITASTPFGDGVRFRSMKGAEFLSTLYSFEIQLISETPGLNPEDIIDHPMCVTLELPEGQQRFFHGIVSRFRAVGARGLRGRHNVYLATMVPWLWKLNLRKGCRIFQKMTVPDIIKTIFRDHGLTDFQEDLSRSYPSRDFRVQYRETDLSFVSRLMEEEGIYYYFLHEATKHTLVMTDSQSGHQRVAGYEQIRYSVKEVGRKHEQDVIDTWEPSQRLEIGKYCLDDYDFCRPRANLQVKQVSDHRLADRAMEHYDYPGGYTQLGEGETYVRLRLEERYATQTQFMAAGDARGITPGMAFKLMDYPDPEHNVDYLVIWAEYTLGPLKYESDEDLEERVFRCEFATICDQRSFRPARSMPSPVVQGPQTAVVVGKEGEDIWTDEYGRIKVQFRWDREGQSNENSSCWVRVAQTWAGANWGTIHIPRIGQEVVISFLEGNPDRPIVVGSVYNEANMPPYELPNNQTQSGIKTRSSLGGTEDNYNEIQFEDKKGEERLNVQAEKNMDTLVKNDETLTVGGNRTIHITGSQSVVIDGSRETSGAGENSTASGGAAGASAAAASAAAGGGGLKGSKLSITGDYKVDASNTIEMQAPSHIKLTCGGSSITITPGKITLSAGGGAEVVLDGNALTHSAAGSQVMLDGNAFVKASGGANVLFDGNANMCSNAGSQVLLDGNATVLSTGGSQVGLSGDATVSSPGKADLVGGPSASVSAATATLAGSGGSAEASGGGVDVSGDKVNITGSGTVNVAGGSVKLN